MISVVVYPNKHIIENVDFLRTQDFSTMFHSYTHKCSPAFRCNKFLGFDGVNSSICEHFNSLLQNFKSSAKLMLQTHFTFYVQFFVHIWNSQKSKSYNKKRNIAVSGEIQVMRLSQLLVLVTQQFSYNSIKSHCFIRFHTFCIVHV